MLLGSARTQQTPAAASRRRPGETGSAPKPKNPSSLVLKTDKDKVSYALGMNLGANLKRDSVDIDTAIFVRALKDTVTAARPS